MDERGKIYWHEAFFEALQLELHQYSDVLTFHSEHRLNEEALRMDVLVIKKDTGTQIKKNIGQIFRGSNIFEYKSEADTFSVWDYNKVIAYAYLYSAHEQIPISDITISVSLTMYPKKLMQSLVNERGLKIEDLGNGIHYIIGEAIPMQILENKRLSADNNLFLRNLRSNLSTEDMLMTLDFYKMVKPLNEKAVYVDRLINANPEAFEEAINMSESIKDIFLRGADKHGWLADRDKENAVKIAKNLLMRGYSAEDVAEATELPRETVISLVK